MKKSDRIIIHSSDNICISKNVNTLKRDGRVLNTAEHISYSADSVSLKVSNLRNINEIIFVKDFKAFNNATLQYDQKAEYHIPVSFYEEDELYVMRYDVTIMVKEKKLARNIFRFFNELVSDNISNIDNLITDNYKI